MFFKLSILVLSCIITANSVLGEPEDENETLRNSYDNCKRWLGKSPTSTITGGDFWLYMGKNKCDYYILLFYFVNNPAAREKQDDIDINLYGELFKHLCSIRSVTVEDWAAYKKSQAASRTPLDTGLLPWGDHD